MNEPELSIGRQIATVQVSDGDGYLPLLEIHGSAIVLSADTELHIDGVRWAVVRQRVDVDTAFGGIAATITVVPYGSEELT